MLFHHQIYMMYTNRQVMFLNVDAIFKIRDHLHIKNYTNLNGKIHF